MPVATWNPLSELRTLIVALAIAGLATVHGGSAFAQTVPEIAPGAVMFVVTVAESLAGFGSGVSVVTDAALLTDPLGNAASVTKFPKGDRKSTRLNSSHLVISYAVFCLKKKKNTTINILR